MAERATTGTRERRHYLDAARGLLMILGVPYHAALIYAAGQEWLIGSPDRSAVLALAAEVGHSFRMPAFFLISGILLHRSLQSHGPWRTFTGRGVRLLVPLLAVGATLNVAQFWLSALHKDPALTAAAFVTDRLPAAFWRGELMLHLWFLFELAVCVAVLCAAYPLARRFRRRIPAPGPWSAPVVLCALLVGTMALDNVSPLFLERIGPTSSTAASIAVWTAYAAAGVWIAGAPGGVRRFAGLTLPVALTFAAAVALHLVIADPDGAKPLRVLDRILQGICAWTGFRLVLGGAIAFFPVENAAVSALAQSSYTVYLLHHPVVVALGVAFLSVDAGPLAEFAAISVAGFAIPYLFHHRVVKRSPLLLLLLNGVAPRVSLPLLGRAGEGTAS